MYGRARQPCRRCGTLIEARRKARTRGRRTGVPTVSRKSVPATPVSKRDHVVVIGAGFGGLAATKRLAKAGVDVTIVDRHNFHTFQPLLYEVATAGLNAADVAYAVRGHLPSPAQRHVPARDRHRCRLDAAHARARRRREQPLEFDHLVVAAGSTTAYFGIPGAAEYAFPLYSLVDAIALRNHILDQLRSGRRRSVVDRRRRAHVRGRRRWRDRRRGLGRDVGAVQRW